MKLVRITILVLTFAITAAGQVRLPQEKVPESFRNFERLKDERVLKCEVSPIRPRIDFGFRFQSGYVVRLPLDQYEGKGHRLGILTRVRGEEGPPVFLLDLIQLPVIPKTNVQAELGGSFLVGEGTYQVDLVMFDEQDRACRDSWKVEAKKGRSEKNVNLRLAPGSIRELGSRISSRKSDEERPFRITVLVHAAPVFTRSTRLRAWDREMLLGTLGPLIDNLPVRSVRLVMFNLDQQKTIFEKDDFQPERLGEAARALNSLELGTVNVAVLQNQGGHINLLADLINREVVANEKADAVILLGPASRYYSKFPESALEERPGRRVFFVQYRPFFRRQAEFPDLLQNSVKTLKGRTFTVHTPAEFANALKKIESELEEHRSTGDRLKPSPASQPAGK